MVWLSKILRMTYNLERREYRFKIKSRWDQDACYKQSWFWLPCCHLIPQRSATVRQSFSSIRTVPNNQWHQVTIIVSQKKKVTLIIILLDQKVQLISHFIELHTLMIYQLFGGTIHAWSGKVSYHPFRRQCFDYYHDIKVSNLLHDHQFGTVIIWEIKNEKRFPHNYDDFMRVHNNAMKLRNRLVPKDLNEKKILLDFTLLAQIDLFTEVHVMWMWIFMWTQDWVTYQYYCRDKWLFAVLII